MAREMKDSGIKWIGEIPKNWEIRKIKNVSEINSGEYISKEDYELQGIFDIIGSNGKIGEINKTNINKKVITTGRVGSIGTSHIVQDVWVTDNALIIEVKKNILLEYLFYIIPMLPYEIISTGTAQPLITATILKNQYIPYSNLHEQQTIADFLMENVPAIDSVIAKIRETLKDYIILKQSIITQAVTKGIRKNRNLKDSQSIWFGQIPSDWNMRKIKYIFKIQKDIAGEEGHTVLSITQKGIKPKDLSKNEGQLAENYSNYQLVHIGDFAMNHMDLLTGWVDISKYEGVTSPDYRVFGLIDKDKYCSPYYLYLMQMCYTSRIFYGLGQGVSGLGRWRLQADKFLNFSITVPSYEEQQEIANYLDKKCSAIDELIAKKEQYLSEIENYKKSLIYEYVTGKKEVPQE